MNFFEEKKYLIWGLAGFYGLTSVIYILHLSGTVNDFLPDLFYLIFPIFAVACGAVATREYGRKSAHGSSIFLMTAGFACWAVAELIWFVLKHVFNTDPFPSVADIFFLAGYPLLAAGAIKELWRNRITLTFNQILLLLAVLVNFGSIVGYFGIYQAFDPSMPLLAEIVAIFYGLADFLFLSMFMFVLFLSQQYSGGRLFYPWFAIFLGMVLSASANVLFAIFTEEYDAGSWYYALIDLLWLASHMMFAYGFLVFVAISKKAQSMISQYKNAHA